MKRIGRVLLGVGAVVSLALVCQRAQAQSASPGVPSAETQALMKQIEATPPLPASEAPKNGEFYTTQHGDSWPPLPGNVLHLNYWALGGGAYLLDDQDFAYPIPGTNASGGTSGEDFQAQVITTNDTWLQMDEWSNNDSYLTIHPAYGTPTNMAYDLWYSTNVEVPFANWQWVLRSAPGQTNLTVSNVTSPQGFYRLASHTDSLGTNFWLGFGRMFYDVTNALSLYITSPVAATGTVTASSVMNGPVLVVTNCGDSAVNGVYSLTNVTNTLGFITFTNAYEMGNYLVFYNHDASNPEWLMYSNGSSSLELYYGMPPLPGDIFLNDVTWTQWYDPNPTPPTTICPTVGITNSFTVAAGGITNVPIPTSALDATFNQVENNYGINVTASGPVSVFAMDYDHAYSAAFTALPTPMLGTNYCVMAREPNLDNYFSEFMILATTSNTTVSITPPTGTVFYGGVFVTNLVVTNLQPGETYQMLCPSGEGDVTGTFISSDQPIAVFAGADVANVPYSITLYGNPLMQEQIPVDDWGTNILALSFAGRTNGDSYRVLAASNDTVIAITGAILTAVDTNVSPYTVTTSNETVVITNSAGQSYDIGVEGPVEFQASLPIQVAHFANGTSFDHNHFINPEADPCEILLLPVNHYLETNILITLTNNSISGDFDQNYLNLIIAQSALTNTRVDGALVAATNFIPIGFSGFYGTQITVTNSGAHKVISSQPVGVEAYGFGQEDAYGYFSGIVQ